MKLKKSILFFATLFLLMNTSYAKQYDIILKGGHVIDPANNINERMDVAVSGKKIALIAHTISSESADKVID